MAVDVARLDENPPAQPAVHSRSEKRKLARSGAPFLEATEGGPAERFAELVGAEHPVRVFLVAALGGYALLVGLTIAVGFLLTDVLLKIDGIASFDQRVSDWFERSRTPTLIDLSWAGSTLAGGVVIPALVGVLLLVFLLSRHWRLAAFTIFVICIESGAYRATSLVVHRDRPDVDRLESLPVNASYPSGHTAASIALFGGLLLVLASRIENFALRILLWSLVVAIPAFVIWSRLLRGMHHATDVAAGLLMGIAALSITVFAARAAGAAADRRDRAKHSSELETTEGTRSMKKIAVIAHAGKTIGGGLDELRIVLERAGVTEPMWSEVPKSKYAPERVRRVLDEGAELVFVWGGDGMVQRSIDEIAGSGVTLAIIPAGTANLFASSLDIPSDITEAVQIGLNGRDRTLDVGKINGERFAVMAGAGLDARMIRDADGGLKDRFGRLAYIWTASKNLRAEPFKARIEINDELWYKGSATCVLLGNIGSLFGGIEAFDNARPDDGVLEVGVTNADGLGQWARTVARTAVGTTAQSPFVQVTKAKKIKVELDRKISYELDGGAREPTKVLKAKIEAGAITVRVPAAA